MSTVITMRIESNPIPMKERTSMLWLQCGNLEVHDGALVNVNATGERTHLPVGGLACISLGVFPARAGMNRCGCAC